MEAKCNLKDKEKPVSTTERFEMVATIPLSRWSSI